MVSSEEDLIYDNSVGKIFSVFLYVDAINVLIKNLFPTSSLVSSIGYILFALFLICFIINIKKIRKAITRLGVLEILVVFLTFISCFRYPTIKDEIFSRIAWTILFCVPLFSLGCYVKDWAIVFEKTKKASFFVLFCGVALIADNLFNDGSSFRYSIKLGYMLLYPCLFHAYKVKNNKKYILPFLVECLIIVMYASRGSLLCVVIFLILSLLVAQRRLSAKEIVIRGVLILLLIICVAYYESLLRLLIKILDKFSINSRTLQLLVSGQIAGDSGRGAIYARALDAIFEKPILGWGLAGDIYCLGGYPHLVFLEIVLDFGIVGLILSIYLIYSIIASFFFYNKNSCFLILLCSGFVPLLMSETFLQAPLFWLMLGMCISRKHQRNELKGDLFVDNN